MCKSLIVESKDFDKSSSGLKEVHSYVWLDMIDSCFSSSDILIGRRQAADRNPSTCEARFFIVHLMASDMAEQLAMSLRIPPHTRHQD